MNAQETIDLIKEHLETGRAIEHQGRITENWYEIDISVPLPDLPRECFRIKPEEPVKEFRMPEGGFWVRCTDSRNTHYWPNWIGHWTICISSEARTKVESLKDLREHFEYSHTRREDDWHSF